MKETWYQNPHFVESKEGTHTLKWTKSNGMEENETILLKGKVENFVNLQLLQSKHLMFANFLMLLYKLNILNEKVETCIKRECHK